MNGWATLVAAAVGLAVGLAGPLSPTAGRPVGPLPAVARDQGLLRRFRPVLALLAGSAGVAFVGGPVGAVVAFLSAGLTWAVCTRAEPPGVRREREAVRRGLPHVTRLLGVVLATGQSVPTALGVVADALPGPASAPLARARSSLAVGVAPERVFADLGAEPGLEPLGRALARSAQSGARVAEVVARLAVQLSEEERAAVEDRARTVGIRAAVPLGLCLLPAFLVLGIVPVVAAALGSIAW